MLSVFNDRWFGQWLALRKPFQQLNGLLSKEVQEKVPLQYAHFANAVLQCPDYWDDEDRVRADLQLEATGNDKILTFLAKVKAQRALVEKFMNGLLTKEDEAGTQDALREVGLLQAGTPGAEHLQVAGRSQGRQGGAQRSCVGAHCGRGRSEQPTAGGYRPSRHGQDHGDRQVRAQMPSTGWPRPLCTTHRPAGLEG